jgi:GTP cyclohydrolase I
MTVEIGKALEDGLHPLGVAVHISAVHQCMSLRGLKTPNVATLTRYYGGLYKNDPRARDDIKTVLTSENQISL